MAATLRCDTIQNASSSTANLTLDASGNATVGNTLVMGSSFKRNRIINGDMLVDQRNAGASLTPTSNGTFSLDRWKSINSQSSKITFQQNLNSVALPAGFTKYLGLSVASAVTSASTDYFGFEQPIETINVGDFAYGTASAVTVTASFWVRSSITGTYGVGLWNGTTTYAIVSTYTINSANTWEYKTVSFTGTGSPTLTIATNDSLSLRFDLGSGTNFNASANTWVNSNSLRTSSCVSWIANAAATFYITGVQLEVGSVATPYERQIYSDQLAQCMRYYQSYGPFGKGLSADYHPICYSGNLPNGTFTNWFFSFEMIVVMRASPTFGWSGSGSLIVDNSLPNSVTALTLQRANPNFVSFFATVSSITGSSNGNILAANNNNTAYISFASEL